MTTKLWVSLRDRALLGVLAVVAINAFALSGELTAGRFDLNDSVLHYTLIDRMAQAIERGENPLDCWVSEWTLGYPVPRTYQILGHVSLALLYLALGKAVSLLTLFAWTRYILVAFLPLTVYVSARLLMLRPPMAIASAALSPLIATNGLYGLEYGSYIWRGSGLFTQAVAMHLLLLTLGFGFRALRGKCASVIVGLLLGLTFLAHFIYGFIGATSLVVLAFIPNGLPMPKRLVRTAVVGSVSFAVAAFQLIPMFLDGPLINHSRWELPWKWDSFGALYVFQTLLRGDLLDYGRLPVLSLLALLGTVVCAMKIRRSGLEEKSPDSGPPSAAFAFVLFGGLLWVLLFCGRPTWGVLFTMLGADDIQLHRLIGGVHSFAFFLSGIGLGTVWLWFAGNRLKYRHALALLVTFAILFPALKERRLFLQQNSEWGQTNLAALRSEEKDVGEVVSSLKGVQGRAYGGLAATWGNQFRVGSVPFYAIFSIYHVPALSFLYHAMALTSDLMVWFDEVNPAHYRLFNVAAVVAPDGHPVAPFLSAKSSAGRFRLYQAPGNGYFDVVNVPYAVRVHPEEFYDVSHAWLKSNWVGRLNHLLLDLDGNMGEGLPRLAAGQALPEVAAVFDIGSILNQSRDGETYEATVELERSGYLLFKMTYHPNWLAIVDGRPQKPVMLTPGFTGVDLSPGQHVVQFRYEPGPLKSVLIVLGTLFLAAVAIAERRGGLGKIEFGIERVASRVRESFNADGLTRLLTVVGLVALSIPVCVPILTNRLVAGHDAFSYVPRLVEFHENIRNGVLLPRWAPDLGNGGGQPLFLFNPPLLYYLAEFWYLLGFEAVTAYNLVCVVVILASAGSMYLLGRLYFGKAGGWVAAAAYIYAPYFHVNLFVRQALAEFVTFPFYPLTLYGFGRYARDRDRRFLLLGAVGFACVFMAHSAAALLFTPVLVAFILLSARLARSWNLLFHLIGGVLLGLALCAFVWVPILMEMQHINTNRLLEGYLNYSNHLVYAQQFFSTNWGFGLSLAGYQDGMSFSLGWSHLLILATAIALSRKRGRKETNALTRFMTWVILAYCFIMTPGALWIWDNLSLLQLVQFPWRMLGPLSVCVAIGVASLAGASTRLSGGLGLAFVLGLLIAPNLGNVRAERYHRINPADWTPEQIARRGVTVATREEYEPRWVQSRPPYQPEKIRVVEGDAKISLMLTNPVSWSAQIAASRESVVQASLSYFPGWTAMIDGVGVPTQIAQQTGEIQFRVPAGEHRLRLEFRRTPPRFYGELIAVVALVVLLAASFSIKQGSRRVRAQRNASAF